MLFMNLKFETFKQNIINIDLSSVVIQQMSAKNKNRKDMKFLKMDMLNVIKLF